MFFIILFLDFHMVSSIAFFIESVTHLHNDKPITVSISTADGLHQEVSERETLAI